MTSGFWLRHTHPVGSSSVGKRVGVSTATGSAAVKTRSRIIRDGVIERHTEVLELHYRPQRLRQSAAQTVQIIVAR